MGAEIDFVRIRKLWHCYTVGISRSTTKDVNSQIGLVTDAPYLQYLDLLQGEAEIYMPRVRHTLGNTVVVSVC